MTQSLDAVPSVTKQGISTRLLKTKEGGYNAGMLKTAQGLFLIARIVMFEKFEGHDRMRFKLAWFKIGDDGEATFMNTVEIPGFPAHDHAEDPRIFHGPNGSIYVSFCHASDNPKRPPCIRIAKFRDGVCDVADMLPIIKIQGNGAELEEDRKPQKNWNFFFQGERLFFIYWTYPHRVVEIDPVTCEFVDQWSGMDDKAFVWQYGPISGGTPPVVWRGQYLAFYHGWMPHPIRRRRYYMGAYTFSMEAPFRITAITAPMMRGSLNDPTNFEPPNHAGLPLVVFPCGLIAEEKDPDMMLVSMGVNDSYMALASFDMRLTPLIPIAELREARTFYFFTQDTAIPPRATQTTHLAWSPTKNGFGGLLATQNPMAIDDCLTRGGVAEISKEVYDELVSTVENVSFIPEIKAPKSHFLFQNITEKACRLPGWSTPEKNIDFASIVLAIKPEVAVEIGVYGGRSLVSIAMAMECVGKGVVHGIDPWTQKDSVEGEAEANVNWWGKLDHESIYRTCVAAVDRFGLGDFVKIQRKRSDEAEVPDDIGLLIIDGNHSGAAPNGDIERYVPKVKIGGFIYCDDIGWIGGAVSKAVERLQNEFGCVLLYPRDEGAMFQKMR